MTWTIDTGPPDTDPAAAFKQALREELDSALEAAARAEARYFTGTWCPTEAQIQANLPWCRAMLLAMAEGKIPMSGGGDP